MAQIRGTDTPSRVVSMADFFGLWGVLRHHLQSKHTLREQVESLLHWEPSTRQHAWLARSTWSDVLTSRRGVVVGDGAVAYRGPGGFYWIV